MQDNKQTYIDFIIDELNKGNVKYNDVCVVFCGKFGLTENTFIKYWKQANEVHKEQREAINEAKLSTTIEAEKEAVKTLVLDKVARMKIAEQIALGIEEQLEGEIIKPSFSDRLKALDYLAKIDGDYASTKIENNVSLNEIKQPNWLSQDFSKDADNS